MLSKLRILNRFTRKNLSTQATTISGFYRFTNSGTLCTVVDSTTQPTPESYELPDWVKFSDSPTSQNGDYDEDFVIPSLAPWVDGHLLHPTPKFVTTQTSQPNNFGEVEVITTLLKEKHPSPEKVAQALAQLSGFKVSHGLVELIMKRFSNNWVSAFGFFTWAKSQTGYEHSPQLYNFMVDILAKSKNFDLMWELVEEMACLREGYVTSDTLIKVMRRLAKAGKHEDAIEAFRRVGKFGVKQDTAMLNALMDALVKGNSVEHAHDALLEFKDSIPLSSHSFNVLIHGWCKVRKFEWAKKAMEDMKKHGFQPDTFSYTTFIESYCREKDFRKVDQVMAEMRENGCTPNAVTYTIVMLALGKAGQLKEALELYEKMKVDGCVPDTAFYSSLIFILGKAGRIKDARDVFEDMPKQGVERDVMTYNTLISIACSYHREETALRLLKEMEDSSFKPELETYHPLLKMCCKKKRMKVLRFLLDHMLRNDVSPDVGTHTLLVHGMCKSGKLESACSFFEEMVLQGLAPKQVTLKLLLGELESKNMIKEKQHIENLMARFPRNDLVTS